MTELEIDINMRIGEWSIIQESGKELKLVHGCGYTGLQNMGNTCYMNSVMQVLLSLPEFRNRFVKLSLLLWVRFTACFNISRYFETAIKTFENVGTDFTGDFNAQM